MRYENLQSLNFSKIGHSTKCGPSQPIRSTITDLTCNFIYVQMVLSSHNLLLKEHSFCLFPFQCCLVMWLQWYFPLDPGLILFCSWPYLFPLSFDHNNLVHNWSLFGVLLTAHRPFTSQYDVIGFSRWRQYLASDVRLSILYNGLHFSLLSPPSPCSQAPALYP